MKKKQFSILLIIVIPLAIILLSGGSVKAALEPTIANHSICNSVRLDAIPDSAILNSKNALRIVYQHTSHGSQITTGMNSLPAFKEGNGGTTDIYDYNSTFLDDNGIGTFVGDGYLDVGDAGWDGYTRDYLDDASNADCNAVMWSWCGEVSGKTEQTMLDDYLNPMNQLELDYPNVMFIYMTGHVDGSGLEGNLHLRNEQIRDYCLANNKILFDFADIESYDPDGTYFGDKYVTDNCDWNDGADSGNWALDWQASHTEDVDWYDCDPSHTEALNGNLKAYAIWRLWATLSGWGQTVSENISSLSFSILLISAIAIVSWRKKNR